MDDKSYSVRRAAKFYFPLFLQAFSQCLTYPLVAAIATGGAAGVAALTGFAQGQTLLFLIGSIGGGLPMTGMVFSRTRGGFAAFVRLNRMMMAALLVPGFLLSLPPIGPWIYRDILKLPPDLVDVALMTLRWGAVMQAGFFLRNEPFVLLMNHRMSAEANMATLVRVVLTAASPWPFLKYGLTGPGWALVAQTIPILIEMWLTRLFARKLIAGLPEVDPDYLQAHRHSRFYDEAKSIALRVYGQFKFTMPLSLGYFLLAAAPLVIAIFVGRTEDSVMMLSIHYLTIGVFNPFGFGALRLQAVQIQFRPEYKHDRRLLHFALGAGVVLGLFVAALAIPSVGNFYFVKIQNLPPQYLGRVSTLMLFFSLLPLVQCLRGRAEGLAAIAKRPELVMYGQISFLISMTMTLGLMLLIQAPGWIMGAVSLGIAMATCTLTVQFGLKR